MTTAAELDQKIQEAAASAREALGTMPSVAVVAGSGLGAFAKRLANPVAVSYDRLRHFPVSTVVGHAGTLVRGTAGGREVVVMNGRKHLYEGVDPQVATLPLRALLSAGVKTVILSNAAGGLNPRFEVGDLMLISDHINWQFRNPLIGPNLDRMGPRFPDMSQPYSRRLMALARDAAAEQGITLREGVYWANMGPTYETKAEVQMLRQYADVVGMSTAIEDIAAVHAGAEVVGISVVTNTLVAATGPTTHDEVMETGRVAGERFCNLVEGILRRLP